MGDSDSEYSDSEYWDSDPEKELSGKYGGKFGSTIRKLEFTGESLEMQRLNEALIKLPQNSEKYKSLQRKRKNLIRRINDTKKEKLDQKNFERRQFQLYWYNTWMRSDEVRKELRKELAELREKKKSGFGNETQQRFYNRRLQFLEKLIGYLDKDGDKEEIRKAWLNLGQRNMKTRARQRAKRGKQRARVGGTMGKKLVDLRF